MTALGERRPSKRARIRAAALRFADELADILGEDGEPEDKPKPLVITDLDKQRARNAIERTMGARRRPGR